MPGHPSGRKTLLNKTLMPLKYVHSGTSGAPDHMARAIWGGFLRPHFGHFLMVCLGRLWAVEHESADIPVVFTPAHPTKADILPFQQDLFQILGLAHRVKLVTKVIKVDQLVIPHDGFNLRKQPKVHPRFRRWINPFFPTNAPRNGPDLYVSRSRLDMDLGRFLGERQFEKCLEKEGYQIFHPQEHDLKQQISAYQGAQRLIFAESSALHLLGMVGGPDQQISVIGRRKSTPRYLKFGANKLRGLQARFINEVEGIFSDPRARVPTNAGLALLDSKALGRALVEHNMISCAGSVSAMDDGIDEEFKKHQRQRKKLVPMG